MRKIKLSIQAFSNVEVKPVPGEKKTDNNKATYNVLFE